MVFKGYTERDIKHVGIYLGIYLDNEYIVECTYKEFGFSGVQLTPWEEFKVSANLENKIVLSGNLKV